MITPELLGYIRGEFAKGKTREEVRIALIGTGKWGAEDLSEAFRIVIPMQSFVSPSSIAEDTIVTPTIKNKVKLSRKVLENLIFVAIGIFCVLSWYFYRPQIVSFWNSGVKSSQELSINSWNSLEEFSVNSWNLLVGSFKKISIPSFSLPSFKFPSFNFWGIFSTNKAPNNPEVPPNNTVVEKVTKEIVNIKDCGIGATPDLNNPKTYQNNAVLTCLGNSALHCEAAKAVLQDTLFPTQFEIIKTAGSCNFKLSYEASSTLTDITGKKLAGQYISCPLNIVKAIDNSQPSSPVFKAPDVSDVGKYASQIYFYGTLGVFMENNVDQNKIQSLGCSGGYISSVVASYQKMQSKK